MVAAFMWGRTPNVIVTLAANVLKWLLTWSAAQSEQLLEDVVWVKAFLLQSKWRESIWCTLFEQVLFAGNQLSRVVYTSRVGRVVLGPCSTTSHSQDERQAQVRSEERTLSIFLCVSCSFFSLQSKQSRKVKDSFRTSLHYWGSGNGHVKLGCRVWVQIYAWRTGAEIAKWRIRNDPALFPMT